MIVICPSRGRPQRAAHMLASLREMSATPVAVAIVVDVDDAMLAEYLPLQGNRTTVLVVANNGGFTGAVNLAAQAFWDRHDILGVVGDDVLFRTPGWDRQIRSALKTPGLAYGNDLIHGEKHPTAVFLSSAIAKALGWVALPSARHQWVDDAWKRLGQELGVLRYLGDVVIEHLHPAVGKADWDEGYRRVFDDSAAAADHAAFERWASIEIAADLANVRPVLEAAP